MERAVDLFDSPVKVLIILAIVAVPVVVVLIAVRLLNQGPRRAPVSPGPGRVLAAAPGLASPLPPASAAEKLKTLEELRDAGVISARQFRAEARLLGWYPGART